MRTLCWRTKRWKDQPCDNCGNNCGNNCDGLNYIRVPAEELKKLEAAREKLYEFLNGKISEQDMLGLANITGQIWKVANRKQWD